jgi:hypothetical protein
MAKATQKPAYLLGLKPGNLRRVNESVKYLGLYQKLPPTAPSEKTSVVLRKAAG